MAAMRADKRAQSVLVSPHRATQQQYGWVLLFQPGKAHRGRPSLMSAARKSSRRSAKLF
jgi:hypothetical protein